MRSSQRQTEGENPSRTCRMSAERVVLLVLVGLLAAALIVICSLAADKAYSNLAIQTLKNKNEALRKILSGERSPTCEAGWEQHGGNCYYFSTTKSSWTDSRRSCTDLGSDLVKIDSREEQAFLTRRVADMMQYDKDAFWIGLTDSQAEGRWFWADRSRLDPSLSFWSDGEPNNWAGQNPAGEDCGRMYKTGNSVDLKIWDDHSCRVKLKSICEKPAEM